MPTTEVVWKGRCVDRRVQEALCENILRLSEISGKKFFEFFKAQVNPTFFNGSEEELNYLISERVFGGAQPQSAMKEVETGIFLITEIALFGLEFPIYDPRVCTPPFYFGRGNRMSFVFMRSCLPELDGQLVQVFSTNPQHRLSSLSPTALFNPTLDVRYYLQSWMGHFLGWVRHFFIPDLYYWPWADYGYRDDPYSKVPRNKEAAEEHFCHLLDSFSEEADSFTQEVMQYQREKDS